ncbi:hypothetical protein LXM94_10110 [Rhizobium sp. TRM95111]|uniref:hypothetical protein n=1 Tax=Rhizobium alarense TaxID=2846851 RepID=UPI001F29046F|nr:hypothetical protein [Rhizobium alarense]MCF3640319.1 hypothetical protein [Rhizobium alarense]
MSKSDDRRRKPHPDDYALWPDGSWAQLEDIWRGQYTWKSDDYEVIRYDDTKRLRETGIQDELDCG